MQHYGWIQYVPVQEMFHLQAIQISITEHHKKSVTAGLIYKWCHLQAMSGCINM